MEGAFCDFHNLDFQSLNCFPIELTQPTHGIESKPEDRPTSTITKALRQLLQPSSLTMSKHCDDSDLRLVALYPGNKIPLLRKAVYTIELEL